MNVYRVICISKSGMKRLFFKTEDVIVETWYNDGDMIENVKHLKILKTLQIKYDPTKKDHVAFDFWVGECPIIEFENEEPQ